MPKPIIVGKGLSRTRHPFAIVKDGAGLEERIVSTVVSKLKNGAMLKREIAEIKNTKNNLFTGAKSVTVPVIKKLTKKGIKGILDRGDLVPVKKKKKKVGYKITTGFLGAAPEPDNHVFDVEMRFGKNALKKYLPKPKMSYLQIRKLIKHLLTKTPPLEVYILKQADGEWMVPVSEGMKIMRLIKA